MHYVNKNTSNNHYLCYVALVAWNCYWSVALNALILNTFYLSYQHSTTISLKSKSQNISIIFYPRNSKVYKYKPIMKKKKKKQSAGSIWQEKMDSETNTLCKVLKSISLIGDTEYHMSSQCYYIL